MSFDIVVLLLLLGVAVAVYLVIAGLVYAGSARRTRRYRPGRPFVFVPVWFLSAPLEQSRAGLVQGRELMAATPTRRHKQTGGASDSW